MPTIFDVCLVQYDEDRIEGAAAVVHFGGDDFGPGEEVLLAKQFADGVAVGNDDAEDTEIVGFGNAQGADVDLCVGDGLDGVHQGTGLVHQKDGQLRDSHRNLLFNE